MSRIYMMEATFLERLKADRKDILAVARTLRTAQEMRQAREELMASARLNLTPKAEEDPTKLYAVDADGVAHVPMVGELTPAAKQDACGAYTAEALTEYGFLDAAIKAADKDPGVSAIALDANTPGGYAEGVDMVAQTFAAAKKPTIALVADSMQSAGYYIGSQADRIVALSPMSMVGSIGVVMEELDDTRKLASEGIDRRTFVSTDAPNKRPDTHSEEGRAQIIAIADGMQRAFTDRVAQGRHTTMEDVRRNFGKGATVFSPEALERGMIDEIRGQDLRRKPAGVAGAAAQAAITDQEAEEMEYKDITPEALSKERPDLLAAARQAGVQEGIAEGVAQERKRLEQLNAFRGINPDGDKAVDEAIRSGKSYSEAAPLIAAATAKGRGREADGENPPDVSTAAQATAGGEQMSPELARMAGKMGVMPQDIAKFSGEKKGG